MFHCHKDTTVIGKEHCKNIPARADVTRSPKQGYQWPHKKDLCHPKVSKTKFQPGFTHV